MTAETASAANVCPLSLNEAKDRSGFVRLLVCALAPDSCSGRRERTRLSDWCYATILQDATGAVWADDQHALLNVGSAHSLNLSTYSS